MNRIKNIIICITVALMLGVGFLLCVFLPRDSYSQSERREKAKLPAFDFVSLVSGRFSDGFENYAVDNFPFRDGFRTIKAAVNYFAFGRTDNNGIYIQDGYIASDDYPYNPESITHAADRFEYIYNNYLTESDVYLSVIPDKNYFLAKKAGALHFDYQTLLDDIKAKTGFARYIDIFDTLELSDYYKTDSHWRQECITDTANTIANAMGSSLFEGYEKKDTDTEFYGVYHGQAALPLPPDSISYLTSTVIDKMTAFDHQNSKAIPVFDESRLNDRDPYEAFLSGPLSLVTVNNPSNTNGKHLIMFRDSFGSSIAPLLCQGYSKVTLIDIRYINIDYLKDKVDFKNADVLFLYSTAVLNNSETIK